MQEGACKMKNKELKHPVPMELDDEQLKHTTGGNDLFNRVFLTSAKENERCAQCGIAF